MAFQWKEYKDIWKGEGVYHLTFAVAGRQPLLGRLVALADVTRPSEDMNERKYTTKLATVRLSPLGYAISRDLREFQKRHPNILVCGKQIMETHLHVVLWVQEDNGKSILEVAKGFRQGVTKPFLALTTFTPNLTTFIPFTETRCKGMAKNAHMQTRMQKMAYAMHFGNCCQNMR